MQVCEISMCDLDSNTKTLTKNEYHTATRRKNISNPSEEKRIMKTLPYKTSKSRKMIKSCSLKYLDVRFLLDYLFLLAMLSFTSGSFETVSEAICEYEDANLIWRDKPSYLLSDVKAMDWYKGKYSHMATWSEGNGFVEYPPYIGRLMEIGETGIKIRTANRSDSGSYYLFLTLASKDHQLEAVTHFEVIVAPSSRCKPTITEEGSILKAELPSEGCGTPHLRLKWKLTYNTSIQEVQNSSLLDLGRNSGTGKYIVCAEGDSAKCFQGNMSDLCTEYTKSQHERGNDGLKPYLGSIIIPTVLAALISAVVAIWWKRRYRRLPLPEIQSYLRGVYKDMTSVSLSPTGKGNFVDVSEVYIDLDFQKMDTGDFQYRETDLTWISNNTSVCIEDIHIMKAHSQNISPIVIVGCSGSGKSTWCKRLAQCWSQNSKQKDANVQGINLPNLEEYQILLYLPLKSSDKGHSFQELLRYYLFEEQAEYLNIITKYIYDKSHAKSTLILIDGFDKIGENEESMSELLDRKLFSSCTVVFTCRPSSSKLIINACISSSIQTESFEICEIPLEKSKAYASKVLSSFSQHDKDFNLKNFLTFTRNLHVQSLLKLPYLCLTLLFIWMENKNPYIEITDVLLRIVEHLLDTAKTDQQCNEKVMKLSKRNSSAVHTSVNKLDERFVKIKNLMYELSMTTEEIFLCETNGLADEEMLVRETSSRERDTLPIEVMLEIGLATESPRSKSKERLSNLTFTNVLIYQLFVSIAIAFKKGQAFYYIVSDMEVALKNSMIIHMLWQLSSTFGMEMFVEIGALKTCKHEKIGSTEQKNKFRYSITKQFGINKYRQVSWLQLLMYQGDLDDEKLLFLTNALKSMDSLTSLVLENYENNDDLVFWMPCLETLKKLTLNVKKCTLLLCSEWNNRIPFKLKEVVIMSVIITSSDLDILTKALRSCENIETMKISPTLVSTGDTEIVF